MHPPADDSLAGVLGGQAAAYHHWNPAHNMGLVAGIEDIEAIDILALNSCGPLAAKGGFQGEGLGLLYHDHHGPCHAHPAHDWQHQPVGGVCAVLYDGFLT